MKLTWKQFKDFVNTQDIPDDCQVGYVDIGSTLKTDSLYIRVDNNRVVIFDTKGV